ncbi:MAG: hypothetical protein KAQ87_05280 [Candidatus Pacebacteria bacterium]|nr:hypothetical protein [Candidatus Paceibacterota bacterium]
MQNEIQQNNESVMDFAYNVMCKKLEMQMNAHNSLENKIGILLGFVGIIVGSVIILIQQNIDLFGLNIFTVGSSGIYLTFLLLVVASQTRIYFDSPDFPSFYSEEALKKKSTDFKNKIIADMKYSYELNMKNQEKKAELYNIAIYCFVISMLFIFLGILE